MKQFNGKSPKLCQFKLKSVEHADPAKQQGYQRFEAVQSFLIDNIEKLRTNQQA